MCGPSLGGPLEGDFAFSGIAEWSRVFAVFGPHVPGEDELARRIQNPAVNVRGGELLRTFDVVDQLANVDCATLVCVGALDAVLQ